MTDDHPELTGYEPGDARPLRSPRVLWAMRALVTLGILALILPGFATIASVSSATASRACAAWVEYETSDATGFSVRFELFGPGGAGWQCYSVGAFGGDRRVASLGIIPSGARLPIPSDGQPT